MKTRMKSAGVALACAIAACGGPAPETEADEGSETRVESDAVVVFTTNYPLAYFARRIGGDRVRVEFPAPPGSIRPTGRLLPRMSPRTRGRT